MCVPVELNGMAFGTVLFVDKVDGYYKLIDEVFRGYKTQSSMIID